MNCQFFLILDKFEEHCDTCNDNNSIEAVNAYQPSPRYWQSAVLPSSDAPVEISINLKRVSKGRYGAWKQRKKKCVAFLCLFVLYI